MLKGNKNWVLSLFQAKNDYDLTPSRVLSKAMKKVGKPYQVKITMKIPDKIK